MGVWVAGWASSLVEDPGIPLVGTNGAGFPSYTKGDSSSAGNLALDNSGGPDGKGEEGEGERAKRDSESSGWDVVTGGRWRKIGNISYRLSQRKNLLRRQRMLVDVACVLAMVGVVFMLIEAELFLNDYIEKESVLSGFLKLVVSISTVMLLVDVITYHVTGAQLTMVENCLEDWRLVVHPRLFFSYVRNMLQPQVESVLSILMFLRLYLLARFFVVHSHLVSDPATQSLGALNKIRIDTMFVFKALMREWPGTVLICLMAAIFLVSSWSVHTCEAYSAVAVGYTSAANGTEEIPARFLQEAMWMSAITFLTIGYGDVTPQSACGRVTAVVTGLLGVGTTALLVAVLAQKLEQSRAEKYLHTFVSRMRLDKVRKTAAANVIKNSLKLWRLRMKGDRESRRVRVHGKLIQAVGEMRDAKNAKLNIGESAVGVIEVNTAVEEVLRVAEAISDQQNLLEVRSDNVEKRLAAIEVKLDSIAAKLRH
nr:hypothetical protein BaRGS_029286 [Batillaria attramentaria]